MRTDLGNRIRRLRISNNDSQEGMASKINVSRQAISKWENNISVPDLGTLQAIAELYGVQINYFTEEDVETEKNTKIRPLFFPDTVLYRFMIGFLSILSVLFLGAFSLFMTMPNLYVNIKKRKILWSVFYTSLVVIGVHILMTIVFPGWMPYSIEVKAG